MSHQVILDFWFVESAGKWFLKSKEFDDRIKDKFLSVYEDIREGKYLEWDEAPLSLLAKIIVLDQFSRNMFRNTKKCFEMDHKALLLARKAVAKGFDKELTPAQKIFLYLPFEHSEDFEDQKESIRLYTHFHETHPGNATTLDYALQHYNIIKRFGRFPHRNKILGRESTIEETEFLKEEGSSF